MPTSLTLETTSCSDGTHVLSAVGEIDLSNIDSFKGALVTAVESARGGRTLTVDLSAVEYLDSAAINVLYTCADDVDNLVAHPLLMSSLTISGLAEVIAIESAPTAED